MEFLQSTELVQSVHCFEVSEKYDLIAVIDCSFIPTNKSKSDMTVSIATGSLVEASRGTHSSVQRASYSEKGLYLSLYNANTKQRIHRIALQNVRGDVITCHFSADNKSIALLEDAPSNTVTCWKIESGILLASYKLSQRAARIRCAPYQFTSFSISGPTLLKLWITSEADATSRWKDCDVTGSNTERVIDHAWVGDYLICLYEHNTFGAFRSTLDNVIQRNDKATRMPPKFTIQLVRMYICQLPDQVRLKCLAVHSAGFALGGSAGLYSLYEPSGLNNDPFSHCHHIFVDHVDFQSLSFSPDAEMIVGVTKMQDIVTFKAGTIDVVEEKFASSRSLIPHLHQSGKIEQLSICSQRQLVLTLGSDRTIRLWNYNLRKYELVHACVEEPSAVSIHPTGFMLAVAFKEKLRVYTIFGQTLGRQQDVVQRSCRSLQYASGGHVFACAIGITVNVYQSYSLQLLRTVSDHASIIRCFIWSSNDLILYCAGADGSVCVWDYVSEKRLEVLDQASQPAASAVTPLLIDGEEKYALGKDGKLRQMTSNGDSLVLLELEGASHFTCMTLSTRSLKIYLGASTGFIYAYTWPINRNGPRKPVLERCAHPNSIQGLCLTEDEHILISAGEDGSVCVFQLSPMMQCKAQEDNAGLEISGSCQDYVTKDCRKKSSESPLRTRDRKVEAKYSFFQDTVLVLKQDLIKQQTLLDSALAQAEQERSESAENRQKDVDEWEKRLVSAQLYFDERIAKEHSRYLQLESKHEQCLPQQLNIVADLEKLHKASKEQAESKYERDIQEAKMQIDVLKQTIETNLQHYETCMVDERARQMHQLEVEREAASVRFQNQQNLHHRVSCELKTQKLHYEEISRQQEQENEQELVRIRQETKVEMDIQRQEKALKQSQVNVLTNKIESLQKKIQELKIAAQARETAVLNEQSNVAKLEAALSQCDAHVQQYKCQFDEKAIESAELEFSNRVLSKFRNVMEHQLAEMREQRLPLEEHMNFLQVRVTEMQQELAQEFVSKNYMLSETKEKDMRIKILSRDVKSLRQKMLQKDYILGSMIREVNRIAHISNVKDMESAVKEAYRTFVIGEHQVLGIMAKKDGISEFTPEQIPTFSPNKKKLNPSLLPPQPKTSDAAGLNPACVDEAQALPKKSCEESSLELTDEVLDYDSKEVIEGLKKQVWCMSKTIEMLQHALDSSQRKQDNTRRDAVEKASLLIAECNTLRKENKEKQIKIKHLEHALQSKRPLTSASASLTSHAAQEFSSKEIFSPLSEVTKHNIPSGKQGKQKNLTNPSSRTLAPINKKTSRLDSTTPDTDRSRSAVGRKRTISVSSPCLSTATISDRHPSIPFT